MAGNYAWRDCAGRTSDAIQFATQMGFVERKDGDWYLSLGEMLRFFRRERQAGMPHSRW